jgi:hypothetical protein
MMKVTMVTLSPTCPEAKIIIDFDPFHFNLFNLGLPLH